MPFVPPPNIVKSEESKGTSPLFPKPPLVKIPKKPIIPPVPKGWKHVCGPVIRVEDCKGLPKGLKKISYPSKDVTRIRYGLLGASTLYFKAPNGDYYAGLVVRTPQTYYEGDVKRTKYTNVAWAYRWAGSDMQVGIGLGGAFPIGPRPEENPEGKIRDDSRSLPQKPPKSGSGGTPSLKIDPDQDSTPWPYEAYKENEKRQDAYRSEEPYQGPYAGEDLPELEPKKIEFLKLGILALLGGVTTYVVARNSEHKVPLAAGGAAVSAGAVYLFGPGGVLRGA